MPRRLVIGVAAVAATAAFVVTASSAGATAGHASSTRARTVTATANAPLGARAGGRVRGELLGAAARRSASYGIAGFRALHTRMLDASRAGAGNRPGRAPSVLPASQLHDWWGSFPNSDAGVGLAATQSVLPDLRLSNSNDVVYSPTMKPMDNSCIEVVTAYSSGTPQVWAWDWCGSDSPAATVNIDSTFLSTYTTTVNGMAAYSVRITQTDASTNEWTASLYNQQTGQWDTLFTSSGTDQSGLSYGWSMYEFYSETDSSTGNTYVCDDTASDVFQSSGISVLTGGQWTALNPNNSSFSPSNPNPSDYECPSLQFDPLSDNDDWIVQQ